MKLRFKLPNFVMRKTSKVVSDNVSKELEGDCHIKINEAEIGMKDKKVYARFAIEGEMDRKDLMKLIKMAMEES